MNSLALRLSFVTFVSVLLSGCATFGPQDKTAQGAESGWIHLFDGTSLEGWRGYNSEGMPSGWAIVDEELVFDKAFLTEAEKEDKTGRNIIYAAQQFENFELVLEWKILEGGNSGIFYHAVEGYRRIFHTAPEYQLLDDAFYSQMEDSELKPYHSTGADYAMYAPDPSKKKLNPVGEWNSSRIVFTPERVEHWLNGELLLSFVPWSEDWHARKEQSKWKEVESYGKYRRGYIGLQDHGTTTSFRNIKVRPL